MALSCMLPNFVTPLLPKGGNPMKKVLSVVCALFVSVAFATLTLAADNAAKTAPKDNTAKTAPADNTAKPAEKK